MDQPDPTPLVPKPPEGPVMPGENRRQVLTRMLKVGALTAPVLITLKPRSAAAASGGSLAS